MPKNESSGGIEALVAVDRRSAQTLGAQVETQLRDAIRLGSLRAGQELPSTRDLAGQLSVSRRVVVDAYAHLAAGGYLGLRQGARAQVIAPARAREPDPDTASHPGTSPRPGPGIRFDFRPSVPDVSSFPRSAWLRSLRHALATMPDAELGYGDPRGVPALHTALADYLGRVRGVVAEPEHIVVTSGYTQGLGLICRALAATGARRVAVEDPSNPEDGLVIARAGLEAVAVGVDDGGIRVDDLATADPDAVVLTPAHQHPTGVALDGERRIALLAWLRRRNAIAVEDDYDAEYRYERSAVGALQGLAPDRIVYVGSASKTLAPALRIGWLVVPTALRHAVTDEKVIADRGTARIDQAALADFIARGELDRHLRRMRLRYRARRATLVEAVTRALPEAQVGSGIAAGLHVTVHLPAGDHEQLVRTEAAHRGIALEVLSDYRPDDGARPPTLLLGYGQLPRSAIAPGVAELAAAVRAARARTGNGDD